MRTPHTLRALGLLTAVAALASYLVQTEPIAAQVTVATPTSTTYGAPLLYDHSVVLTQGLPDDDQAPGVSIAAYPAP
jgi:uncharacterized protein YcfJ